MAEGTSFSKLGAQAIKAVAPSVVRINGQCDGTSGTVVSVDGLVVAAHHAIGASATFDVHFEGGRVLAAKVVGRDAGTDLALLKVDATDLTPVRWRDEGVEVGEFVLTVGRPGKTARTTLGVISAVGTEFRTMTGGRVEQYIDVDASLPHGFSGGPLIDFDGAALGLNTAALARGGVLLPAATVKRVVEALVAHGKVGRGYLGVGAYPTKLPDAVLSSLATKQQRGLVVVSLDPSGPGEKGGLLLGDVIVSLDGQKVEHPGELRNVLEARANAEVAVKLIRAGALVDVTLTTGTHP